jgi:hypothetical protein
MKTNRLFYGLADHITERRQREGQRSRKPDEGEVFFLRLPDFN